MCGRRNCSFRQTRIRRSLPRRAVEKDADTRDLERDLSRRIGLKVTLKPARNGGTVTIAYRTLDQLDAVITRLRDDRAERRQRKRRGVCRKYS